MKIRYALALAATVATMALTTGTASADRGVTYTAYVPADATPCGAFVLDVFDGTRYVEYPNGSGVLFATVTGNSTVTVTSETTGRSIDLNISGPVHILDTGDWVGNGAWLLVGTMSYIRGYLDLPGGDPALVQAKGTTVDLCEVLVG